MGSAGRSGPRICLDASLPVRPVWRGVTAEISQRLHGHQAETRRCAQTQAGQASGHPSCTSWPSTQIRLSGRRSATINRADSGDAQSTKPDAPERNCQDTRLSPGASDEDGPGVAAAERHSLSWLPACSAATCTADLFLTMFAVSIGTYKKNLSGHGTRVAPPHRAPPRSP